MEWAQQTNFTECAPHKKAPTLRYGAFLIHNTSQPESQPALMLLLGFGSASSSRGSSVSSGLGCISCRSSSVGCRGSSVGSCRRCGFSRCCGRSGSFHRCGSCGRSGFFLLAASGEGSSSNQSGQNERVLHLGFLVEQTKILKSRSVRPRKVPAHIGTAFRLHLFRCSRELYW